MCGVVFGGDNEAAGVPVNAVDNAGAQFAADAGEAVAAVVQQSVHQGAVGIPRCRVHHHARGLVKDADGGLGLVYVLAAGSGAFVGGDLQILHLDGVMMMVDHQVRTHHQAGRQQESNPYENGQLRFHPDQSLLGL